MGRSRGRKAKAGRRRLKSGRIAYDLQDRLVKGNHRAQAMQALYGQDGCDAIGRAYRNGLLGSGSEAKNLLDTARHLATCYWQAYETGAIRCVLADQTHGATPIDADRIRAREERIAEALREVDSLGRRIRRAFDELVIDVHPDDGPAWLDRMCAVEIENRRRDNGPHIRQSPIDQARLNLALEVLRAVS